jgi:Mg-chelatase subunit ChlI
LLDRFGLCVEVEGLKEPSLRAEVVRRCAAFEKDPIAFTLAWEKPQEELRHLIVEAKNLLTNVTYSDDILELAARISIDMGVDGHRSDIAMVKTAQALAATHLRCEVVEEDIREAAELVLFHRARRKPFQKPQANPDRIDQSIRSQMEKHAGAPPHSHERPAGDPRDPLKKKIR